MTTKITAIIAAGNFEADDAVAEANRYADVFRAVALENYPNAELSISVMAHQTGGGKTTVEVDGEIDEDAAELLDSAAGMRAY